MAEEYVSYKGQRYRVERQIAVGGMRAVFLATNVATGQLVQLQASPEPFPLLPEVVYDVMKEVGIKLLDEGKTSAGYFRILENIPGNTLDQIILERGPLSINEALEIVLHVALALAEVHERGIIHRDIKPSNILLTETGEPKLIDFGIATLADKEPEVMAFTPGYAAPEQYSRALVDQRTDIFALGVTLYTLLTGKHPPEQPLVSVDMSFIPDMVRPIISKAIAPRREQRFQSARDLAASISQVLENQVVVHLAGKEFVQDFFWTIAAIFTITLIGTLVYASQVSPLGLETSVWVLAIMVAVAAFFTLVRWRRKARQF